MQNNRLGCFITTVLDWFFPPTCMACRTLLPLEDTRRRAMWLCAPCETLFELHEGCASFVYDGIVRDLIRDIKFRGRKHIALGLGRLWAGLIDPQLIPHGIWMVPMPLHPNKQRERGFNQACLLVQALADTHPHAVLVPALERIIDTPPQAGLHPRLRAENVKDAFSIASGVDVRGKSIVLVDDIYTTGASINECIRVLKDAGVAQVTWLTLAVTLKKDDRTN